MSSQLEITPNPRPIYDEQIDGKDEKEKDQEITSAPVELGWNHHLDGEETEHVKRCVLGAR
jgi:hypothetical protein